MTIFEGGGEKRDYVAPQIPPETTIEKSLSDAKLIREVRKLGGRRGDATLIELDGGILAVFKSYRRMVSSARENINRERAAYLIDRILGFGMVPPTVVRQINGETGSVQEFIANAKEKHDFPYPCASREEFTRLEVFSALINEVDLNTENFLITDDTRKIVSIDHGRGCLGPGLANSDWLHPTFKANPIPTELRESLGRFLKWEEGKHALHEHLEQLLGSEIADTYSKRIMAFIAAIDENGFITSGRFREKLDQHGLLEKTKHES